MLSEITYSSRQKIAHFTSRYETFSKKYIYIYRHYVWVRVALIVSSRKGCFYVGAHFPSCEKTREINSKTTLEWAHKSFDRTVHTLSYFWHDIMDPKYDDWKRRFSQIDPVSHSLGLRSADDVTSDCWRHKRSTRYNSYARTRNTIAN